MGMFIFAKEAAEQVGHDKAFVMDLRRQAWLPITADWFPWLENGGAGVIGHATKRNQATYETSAMNLLTHQPQNVEKLGPSWPRRR